MNDSIFKNLLIGVACFFTVFFCVVVIPPLLASGDIIGAFAAGFVNPFATGYSTDVILCWVILAFWVIHDASNHHIKYGWLCLLLGAIPGVAVGFALYLILRLNQLEQKGRLTNN